MDLLFEITACIILKLLLFPDFISNCFLVCLVILDCELRN